ncbi:MAG: response regulator transcription factor [Pseudomonadota bacterium]
MKWHTQPLKVLLVDDQQLLLHALTALLNKSPFPLDVVGLATNGREAIELALQLEPDLILLDLLMPVMNGHDAAYQISRRLPETRILMLSSRDNADEIALAHKSGAHGYILKNIDQQALNKAITRVMSGHYDFIEPNTEKQANQYKQDPYQLTRREQQILKMLVEGEKSRNIAAALNISIRTVEKHRANLKTKLNYPTPIELAEIARKLDLLVP